MYLLHQLLGDSASLRSDSPAIVCEKESLTYSQLDAMSNQVAHYLIANGLQPGDRVGILMKKSVSSLIAVFGALKAGAVYVPIDSTAPAKRISFIIRNCSVNHLFASFRAYERLLNNCISNYVHLPEMSSVMLFDGMDQAWTLNNASPATLADSASYPSDFPPCVARTSDDIALIIYTSGSTGEPKGVMISHRAALTFVNWACECFAFDRDCRVTSAAPLHFDLSVLDTFATIMAGGTIVVVPDAVLRFPASLAKYIRENAISVWYSVPSALIHLLKAPAESLNFPELRQILFAGEVFPKKHLQQLCQAIPDVEYYNLYGPTETNVCTYYQMGSADMLGDDPLPIGKAISNSEVFVITEDKRFAAEGEVGQLYVRGPLLMSGYWGSPEQTQKVMTAHPLVESAWGEVCYRTGDLVRQRSDGNLQFVGRVDNMIKSRGYRIELEEIESVLYRHDQVLEAAVLAVEDEDYGTRLIAVVVAGVDQQLDRQSLSAKCVEYLPSYMIPEAFHVHDSLPRTSTGKVDKTSLKNTLIQIESE